MNKENAEKLYSDFPRLYRDKDNKASCMCWGFSCSDGWFQLIYDLSAAIEAKAKELGIEPASKDWPLALQVKEKFGKLCFYIKTPEVEPAENLIAGLKPEQAGLLISLRPVAGIKAIRELVSEAEQKSVEICETCGQPGTLRREGWWKVRCDACQAKKQKERVGGS